MKKIKFIIVIITAIFATSCEEVVDIDLDTAASRLVVDASIEWLNGTDGSQQTIRLTTTTGYYNKEVPVVTGATVFVTNSTGTVFNFAEDTGTGNYNCVDFVPVVGETYTLTITYNGDTYTATETLYATPQIDNIVQDDEGGFFDEDIEIRFYFQDNAAEDNFYLVRFDADAIPYPDYDALDDRFFQGNQMFGIFSDEDLESGDELGIKLCGISRRYFDYMEKVLTIVEGGAGSGPFQTVPSNVTGNVVNNTNTKKIAYGYFRLSEASAVNYTIQ